MLVGILVAVFTSLANIVLGFITFAKNPKSATNRLLAFLALQIAIWAIINYFSLHQQTEVATLFWIRLDMLPGALMGPSIYLLVKSFPGGKLGVSKLTLLGISLLVGLTIILALSPYMFTSAIFEGGNIKAVPGPAIVIFAINFLGFLSLAFVSALRKYSKAMGLEKLQLKYLLSGLIITFSLIATTQFFAVILFKTSFFIPFGPLYTLILVGSIS